MAVSSYPPNENLVIDPWLRDFMWGSSLISLVLGGLTFVFQLSHPRSR